MRLHLRKALQPDGLREVMQDHLVSVVLTMIARFVPLSSLLRDIIAQKGAHQSLRATRLPDPAPAPSDRLPDLPVLML